MRSGLLIPLFLHTCVAAVVGNAPVKFEALIFFTFNDINKNVRPQAPQAPQAAQAPMCHSTRPIRAHLLVHVAHVYAHTYGSFNGAGCA